MREWRELTRSEHLAWAKRRALEYVERGELDNAIASLLSDLQKHEETQTSTGPLLLMMGVTEKERGPDAVRRWIEGFD